MCKKYFDILNRLGVTHECDKQTDGRTDEQTDKHVIANHHHHHHHQSEIYSAPITW